MSRIIAWHPFALYVMLDQNCLVTLSQNSALLSVVYRMSFIIELPIFYIPYSVFLIHKSSLDQCALIFHTEVRKVEGSTWVHLQVGMQLLF